jgi:hypothetical protein
MLYCRKCKVRVRGGPRRCPLCQGALTGDTEPENNIFPVIPPSQALPRGSFKRFVALVAFGTVVVAAVSAAVNISFYSGAWWFPFVLAGLGSLWFSFLVINRQRRNIPKNIFLQLMVISILALSWDFFTGFYKWSLNFVIPILFSSSMVALAVYAKVRKLRAEDYIFFLCIISLISIFSLLLIIFHVVAVVYPAVICFALSVISLAFLLLFEGKLLKEELKRRMHW